MIYLVDRAGELTALTCQQYEALSASVADTFYVSIYLWGAIRESEKRLAKAASQN
jgi:hypothetical protein